MKFSRIFIIVLLASFIFSGTSFFLTSHYSQPKFGEVCFGVNCFQVKLATTLPQQQQGLMFQKTFAPDAGMLFVFNREGSYDFWMKNTLIPLDIIWLDSSGNVVFMAQNALPCSQSDCPLIKPSKSAKYVLELHAGIAKEIGLQEGSEVKITMPPLHFPFLRP